MISHRGNPEDITEAYYHGLMHPVSYHNFNVTDLMECGISLMHTPDVLTETAADMFFLLILGVARRITEMQELVRNRK